MGKILEKKKRLKEGEIIPLIYDEAFKIIEESLGSHFDPELGRIFIKCRPELEAYYNKL